MKLLQFNAQGTDVLEASRWDLPPDEATGPEAREQRLVEALEQARAGREFRGRDAIVCLGSQELHLQNVRVPKQPGEDVGKLVWAEVRGRLPFPAERAELRYLEAADVKQGDQTQREIIALACDRQVLEQRLRAVEAAGLRPVAVDTEPTALLRCYARQYRRDSDKDQRSMLVNVGYSKTLVVIARGSDALFVKYIPIGAQQFDEALARRLKIDPAEATSLRRHNGDRRADQQDDEVARSVAAATRPVVDRLANELSLCVRYHSVTFRGQPLARLVLSGGEAGSHLQATLAERLTLPCELGDPLRSWQRKISQRHSQWDVATGLALHPLT